MNEFFVSKVATELKLNPRQVLATSRLLAEGATVPFIARYRKEATGSLDEVAITAVRDRMLQLVELEERRASVLKSLEERQLLSPELKSAIEKAELLSVIEDLYAPYRPKRRTRAMAAASSATPLGPACENDTWLLWQKP